MPHTNPQIARILAYLQASTMSAQEKAMWTLLVPHLEEQQLTKLEKILEQEVQDLTDVYLEIMAQK